MLKEARDKGAVFLKDTWVMMKKHPKVSILLLAGAALEYATLVPWIFSDHTPTSERIGNFRVWGTGDFANPNRLFGAREEFNLTDTRGSFAGANIREAITLLEEERKCIDVRVIRQSGNAFKITMKNPECLTSPSP